MGVQPVPQSIADQVQAEDREDDRQAWEDRNPPGLEDQQLARLDDVAPTGSWRGDPRPEEAEPRLGDDRVRKDVAGLDDEGRQDVGGDVKPEDAAGTGALEAYGVDEVLFADLQDRGADDTRDAGGIDQRQGDDDISRRRSERGHEGYREQDPGNGHEPVAKAHQEGVEKSVVAGVEPQDKAEGDGQEGYGAPHPHRDPASVDDAGKQVASVFVRPHPVCGAGRAQALHDLHLQRVVPHEQGRGEGREGQQKQEKRAQGDGLVGPQAGEEKGDRGESPASPAMVRSAPRAHGFSNRTRGSATP